MADLSLSSFLAHPVALAGMALILPIILLYLLKPKPNIVIFPSTMFIRFMEKNKRFSSFLQRFIHDPLLIMQVLIILLIVLAAADPFYKSKQALSEEESVAIVIDASASMQSTDAGGTRFSAALSKAKEIVAGLNMKDDVSIIVAENIPAAVASKATVEEASSTIGKLKAADTPTNVGDAMTLARDMLVGSTRKKAMYVLSDFASGGGMDPLLARKIALASGFRVEMVRLGSGSENAGIVGFEARRSSTKDTELFITSSVVNYGSDERKFTFRLLSGDQVLSSEDKTLEGGDEAFFVIRPNVSASEQIIRAELVGGDDLVVDDAAYAYVTAVKETRVLLLTSEGSDKFLRYMLESLKNVHVEYAVPPVTPDVNGFDVIVLGNVKADNILPGMFRDIKNRVSGGASLVVVASDSLQHISDADLWSIMPVDMQGLGSRETAVKVTEEHEMLTDVVFDNVVAKKYYNAQERDNSTKTLVGAQVFQNPMLSYRPYGGGYVTYMGLNSDPDWGNMYYSSSFPILWSQMIKYFTGLRSADSQQALSTGEYLQAPKTATIKLPSGESVGAQSMFLDKAGVYEISYPDRSEKVPVNLLDAAESNITGMTVEGISDAEGYTGKRGEIEVNVEMYRQILALMILALAAELLLYRRRGLI